MKQILHIFAKDVRHLWGEIFLSIAITVAFTWTYPSQWLAAATFWAGHRSQYASSYSPYSVEILTRVLMGLVPVSWWLLISNLVHDERLVGDRQFWLTRPYEWKKLLASKVLFLLAFLYLPLLIAQCYLLVVAGFSPLSFITGLLFNLLLISCAIVLPLVALATVTSNFARMTLTLLGVVLSIGLLAALFSKANLEWIMLPGESGFFLALVVGLCAAAVVSQYASRRTWVSILLLAALPISYLSIGSLVTHCQRLINSAYSFPATGSQAPVQLSFDPSAPLPPIAYVPRVPNQVGIEIPLQVSGIANQSVVIPEAVRATIESPSGDRWQSGWQLIYNTKFLPDITTARVGFAMPRSVYDRLKERPLTMHLTLLLTQAQVASITRVSLPARNFTVPDFGVCSPQVSLASPGETSAISCLSALREPRLTQIRFVQHTSGCNSSPDRLDTGLAVIAWQGSLDAAPAQFGLGSVKFPFGAYTGIGSRGAEQHLCTPITFSRYDLNRRAQATFSIKGFELPTLTPGQVQVITNP